MHVIVLASFVAFTASSPQYAFVQADLAKIDRAKTPWVIAAAHAPWRTSNTGTCRVAAGARGPCELARP